MCKHALRKSWVSLDCLGLAETLATGHVGELCPRVIESRDSQAGRHGMLHWKDRAFLFITWKEDAVMLGQPLWKVQHLSGQGCPMPLFIHESPFSGGLALCWAPGRQSR